MTATIAVTLCGLGCLVGERDGCEWLSPVHYGPESPGWVPLALAEVHEVTPSSRANATSRLDAKAVLLLDHSQLEYFTGCRTFTRIPMNAYLVRAVYGHEGTGAYTVSRREDDLLVYHSSLGRSSPCHKSAVVLTIDFTPREIYVARSVAE